jgi:hypothetical protein
VPATAAKRGRKRASSEGSDALGGPDRGPVSTVACGAARRGAVAGAEGVDGEGGAKPGPAQPALIVG